MLEVHGAITGSISSSKELRGSLSTSYNTELQGGLSIPSVIYERYELQPATTETLGGVIVGDDLIVTAEGRISVDKATSVLQDNTKPITAAAVYTEVGNINALLATI